MLVLVVRVRNDLVVLLLRLEQFLQPNDAGEQQGDLADDQGLEGDQGQEANGQGSRAAIFSLKSISRGIRYFFFSFFLPRAAGGETIW